MGDKDFSCCINCVPPDRFPGCHSICNKYKKDKLFHEVNRINAKKNMDRERQYPSSVPTSSKLRV